MKLVLKTVLGIKHLKKFLDILNRVYKGAKINDVAKFAMIQSL